MKKGNKLVKISVRITEHDYVKLQILKEELGFEDLASLVRRAVNEMLLKYSKLVETTPTTC